MWIAKFSEGHENEDRIFDENDWTVENSPKVLSYPRSKTAAEKAAWEFVKNIPEIDNRFVLTCINPTLIVGPLLMDTQGTSITVRFWGTTAGNWKKLVLFRENNPTCAFYLKLSKLLEGN